jgi:hypothetical protein
MLQLLAICRGEDPVTHFSLTTSLIFRMDNLLPAIITPLSFDQGCLQAEIGIIQRHFISLKGWPESP